MPYAGLRAGSEDRERHPAWARRIEQSSGVIREEFERAMSPPFNVIRPEFALCERAFQRCHPLMLHLKTRITSRREPLYRRPLFVGLSILGVVYANVFGPRAARVSPGLPSR